MREAPLLRSYLYAPGSRPELLAKAYRAGADAVIFDLEDAVSAAEKDRARDAVAEAVRRYGSAGERPGEQRTPTRPPQLHVRINRRASGYDRQDLAAVVLPGLAGLRLPKVEDPGEVAAVGRWLDAREAETGASPPCLLYPTIESAVGVLRAGEIAAADPRVARLAFGAADLLADLGAPPGGGDAAALLPRSQLVLHSRAAGIGAPVDGVYPHVHDDDGLRAQAQRAWSEGFSGKSVVHPRQLPVVHAVFTPGPAEVAAARRVLEAFDAATVRGDAALLVDGEFVDPAVVARARKVLALAAVSGQDREGGDS